MPQTNPFRMAVDIGMILAFTLTAFFAPILCNDTCFDRCGVSGPGRPAIPYQSRAKASSTPNPI